MSLTRHLNRPLSKLLKEPGNRPFGRGASGALALAWACLIGLAGSSAYAAPPTLATAFQQGLGHDLEAQRPHRFGYLDVRIVDGTFQFSGRFVGAADDAHAPHAAYRPMSDALQAALQPSHLLPAEGILFSRSPLIERRIADFLRGTKTWSQGEWPSRWVPTVPNPDAKPFLRISMYSVGPRQGEDPSAVGTEFLVGFGVETPAKPRLKMRGHDCVDLGEERTVRVIREGRHSDLDMAFRAAFGMDLSRVVGCLDASHLPRKGRHKIGDCTVLVRSAQIHQLKAAEHLGDDAKFREILVRFLSQYQPEVPSMAEPESQKKCR